MNSIDTTKTTSMHETQSRRMALQEELAMHEATLQTLLRRQQALDVNKTRLLRHEHATNLESLKLRRETLEQARLKHLALQQEIEEALKKSQERLDRAVAASVQVDDDGNGVSAQDDDDEVMDENGDESFKDEGPVGASESLPLVVDAQVQDVQITVPRLHCHPEIMQNFWNVASDTGLAVFLPCLNSVDLIQRIMHVTALETLALDHSHPNHRLESMKRTSLDFFSTASRRMDCDGMVENLPVMMEGERNQKEKEGAIDPNVALCPYELAGICADAFCPYQHIKPRSTPNLAWELLPLPKLKLPEIPGDKCMEGSPRKRPRTEDNDAIEQIVDPSDERKEKRPQTEKADTSKQTFDPPDAREEPYVKKEKNDASYQTAVALCNAGTEEGSESGSKGDRVEAMDWNDDFLSLPPRPEVIEKDDSVSSDGSVGQDKDSASDTANLDNEGHGSLSVLWWFTDDDAARVKNFSGTLSTLHVSVTDWLKLVGGFQIKHTSDDESIVVAHIDYPKLPTEAISVVGRVVDCVRLAVHAGRFDLAHALCEFARKSLSNLFPVKDINNDLEVVSNVGIILARAVEYLAREGDRAFCFNSDSRATFCCAFEVQVSMAFLALYLKRLHKHQTTDDQSDLCGSELDELFALFKSTILSMHQNMATHIAQEETSSRTKQEQKHQPLKLFTGDEADKEANSAPSNMIQLGQTLLAWAMAMDSSKNSLVTNILKPALSDLRLMADKTYKEGQCMTTLVIVGYVILGCAQSACCHVNSQGDALLDFSATLTPIDSCIHKLVVSLTNIASTEPLAELLLAPLYALSVSLASTLRRYGKAQQRLEVALNGVSATRQISGGYMIYSELLWSQLIQLQCCLPQGTTNQLPNAAGHELIARLVHGFGVHPNHVTLSGDWNLMQEQVRYELCQRAFFGGKPLVCTLTRIQMPAFLSVTSLAFPRSAMIVGSHLSALIAKKCQLRELPVTFGQHFPNMKILDLAYNCLTELPESIGKLHSLHRLNVSHNSLRTLSVGSLKKLVRLYANHNELTALPDILGCNSLEELDLSHNPILSLPSDLPLRLTNLWKLCVGEIDPAREGYPPKSQAALETLAHIDSHGESQLSLESDPPVEEDPQKSQAAPEILAPIGCSEQPTLLTIACIDCGEVKRNDGFYKNQWKLRNCGGATCKSCWDSRHHLPTELLTAVDPPVEKGALKSQPAPEALACISICQVPELLLAEGAEMEEDPPKVQPALESLACFQCAEVKGKGDFYTSQWKLKDQRSARCKPCWDTISLLASFPQVEEALIRETLACVDCGTVKEQEGFYRNQWKLRKQGGARCKPCWDQYQLILEASLVVDSSVEKESPKSETAFREMLARIVSREVDGKEESKLESAPLLVCIECGEEKVKEAFSKSQWKLRGQGGARCKPCLDTHEEKSYRILEPSPPSFGNLLAQLIADNPVIEVPPKVQLPPEKLTCINCRLVKEREGFYKNQWKLRSQGCARCKRCWDIHQVSELSTPKKQPSDDDSNSKSGDRPQMKTPEPLETLACIDCGVVNEKEGFYQSAWKLREQGCARCKPCWDSHLVAEGIPKADTPVEKMPILETLACLDCAAVKNKDGFYKGQWKLREQGGARCKACWDIRTGHVKQDKKAEAIGDPLIL